MKTPASVHLFFALAVVILVTSGLSPITWYFVPVSFAFIRIYNPRYGLSLSTALACVLLLSAYQVGLFATDLDYVTLSALLLWGFILAVSRRSFKGLFLKLSICLGLVGIAAGIFFARASFQGDAIAWSVRQLDSQLLPLIFREASWGGDAKYFYEQFFNFAFRKMLLGAYLFHIGLVMVFNLLLYRMADPIRALGMAFWEKFSQLRPPEWILVPLVLGLALVAISYDQLSEGTWSWSLWWGWNIGVLSLLPFAVNGLSLVSYLLPRLGIFFVFLTIFLFLTFNPYPFLILAGLADIWFDFRRRMRSNPKTD